LHLGGFLHYGEYGVGRVVGYECLVALRRGESFPRVGRAQGEAINEEFGPLNIGLGGRGGGGDCSRVEADKGLSYNSSGHLELV